MTDIHRLKPRFIYGTAWKEERTAELTTMAVIGGVRAIDTANQRKHYFEAGVGEALQKLFETNFVRREDLFLQTKFTYLRGQDHRLPYDPAARLTIQVEQSFSSSLDHLGTDYIDSYVLHGPATGRGLTKEDHEVWRAMETLHARGKARHLGVSNVSLEQLKNFYNFAEVKPTFVQNRCYGVQGWDFEIRNFCQETGIIYQGFSLLTANVDTLNRPEIKMIAQRHQMATVQVIFRFAQQVGMYPLTGTTSSENLKTDLASESHELSSDELNLIQQVAL